MFCYLKVNYQKKIRKYTPSKFSHQKKNVTRTGEYSWHNFKPENTEWDFSNEIIPSAFGRENINEMWCNYFDSTKREYQLINERKIIHLSCGLPNTLLTVAAERNWIRIGGLHQRITMEQVYQYVKKIFSLRFDKKSRYKKMF